MPSIVGTEAAYVPYEFVKDGKIIGYDPLSGKIIGVQVGSAAAGIIKVYEAKLTSWGTRAEVKQYEHFPEAYQDLLNKRTDAVVNSGFFDLVQRVGVRYAQ